MIATKIFFKRTVQEIYLDFKTSHWPFTWHESFVHHCSVHVYFTYSTNLFSLL